MIPATHSSSSRRPPHRRTPALPPSSSSSSFSESAKATSKSPSPTSTDLAAPEREKRARSPAAASISSAPDLKPPSDSDLSSSSNSGRIHQLLLRSADEKPRLSLWDVDGSLWVPPLTSPQQAAAIVSPTTPMRTARTAPAASGAFAAAVNDDDPDASVAPSPPLSVSVSPSLSSSSAAANGPSAMMLPGSGAMVVTDDYHSTATSTSSSTSSSFSWQKLSLDRAVAPLLRTPVAPFVSRNNERKRALLNATYYSECFLHSIGPKDADTAALDAQSRYEKWWVGSTYRGATAAATAAAGATGRASVTTHPEDAPNRANESNRRRRVSRVQPAVSDSSRNNSAPYEGGPCTIPAQVLPGESEDFDLMNPLATLPSQRWSVDRIKAALVEDLRQTGGDVTTPAFVDCLDRLHAHYKASGVDDRWGAPGPPGASSTRVDGTWIALSKPTFSECLGRNDRGLYLYTLGRLSFDMFRPTSLKCSLRGVFNTISLPAESSGSDDEQECEQVGSTKGGPATRKNPRPSTHPGRMARSLQERYGRSGAPVRNYDIVVAFTIEAHQTRRGEVTAPDGPDPSSSATSPSAAAAASAATANTPYRVRRPIRGLLTNHGYVIPDPNVPNRLSIWFSGGTLECHQDEDLEDWRELFHHGDLPRRDLGELARVLAAKVLLGATSAEGMSDEDGSMSYHLRRPIGGHGQVFCDVLYGDDDLRILRGHHGTVYVHRRVPNDDGSRTDTA